MAEVEWHHHEDDEGNRYYYNDAGETRWDRPDGYVTSDDEEEDEEEEDQAGVAEEEQPAVTVDDAVVAEETVHDTSADIAVDDTEAAPAVDAEAYVETPAAEPDAAVVENTDAAANANAAPAAEPENVAGDSDAAGGEVAVDADVDTSAAYVAPDANASGDVDMGVAVEEEEEETADVAPVVHEEAEPVPDPTTEAAGGVAQEEEEEASAATGNAEAGSGSADSSALQAEIDSLKAENAQLEQDKNQLQSELAKERVKAMGAGGGGGGGGGGDGSSSQMLDQAEKLMKTQQNFAKAKERASKLESEVGEIRESMVRQIAGSSAAGSSYQNVPMSKLLDLYKKSFADSRPASRAGGSRPGTASSRPATASRRKSADTKALQAKVNDLEAQVQDLEASNQQLKRRSRAPVGDGIIDYASYPSKLQNQKRMYASSQAKLNDANEKIVKLSQHIEKLMLHLKHESAAKVKAAKTVRRLEKTTAAQKEYIRSLERKLSNRDRTIKQLRAGAKILEDQLQLMDEKYIEIRGKLDWTRQQSKREVAKIQKEANALRAKWALAGGLDLDHLIGKKNASKMTKMKPRPSSEPVGRGHGKGAHGYAPHRTTPHCLVRRCWRRLRHDAHT